MNRRQFVGTLAAGVVAAPLLASAKAVSLPRRILGRTGISVPILGFGAGSRFLMYQEEDQALEALNKAIDLGIYYIDTAHSYGNGKSEEWIGKLMPSRRRDVVLATKIPGRTADQARREIELSLKRLSTDRLEVLHIHALADDNDLRSIEAKGGVLEAVYEAREQKITKAIGITCHAHPQALRAALLRHDFDCVQIALNAALARMADTSKGMKATGMGYQSFESLALPVAVKKKMGIIAMKVFGQEQILGTSPIDKLLSYSLSLPVSLASVGMPKLEHIDHNVSLAAQFTRMSEPERRRMSDSIDLGKKMAHGRFFVDHVDV